MNKAFCLILFTLLFVNGLLAQDGNLEPVQQLSISNGLAHNGVTSILKDSKGYLWVGTYDGLNRYDGYGFETFKNTTDKNILESNRIRTITEDNKGNLWLGTDEGVSVYNYSLQRFTNVYSNHFSNKALTGPVVRKILVNAKKGLVICATEGFGLLIFKDDYTFVHQYLPVISGVSAAIQFYDGLQMDDVTFLFSTSVGLIKFNLDSKIFVRVLEQDVSFSRAVLFAGENTILATNNRGIALIRYSKTNSEFSFTTDRKDLVNYEFTSAALDSAGNVWIGTLTNGVVQLNNITAFKNHTPYKLSYYTNKSNLLRVSCFSVFSTGCWVGTFNKGVLRFNSNVNPFDYYNSEKNFAYGIRSNEVLHSSALDSNRIYISSNHGGVALFNTRFNRFEPLPFNIPAKYTTTIGGVYVDSKKNTWIKVNELGLIRIKAGSGIWEMVGQKLYPAIATISPRSFDEDTEGNIWIGANEGAYKIFINNSDEITGIQALNDLPFFGKNKISLVRYVYVDTEPGYIWVGTDAQGLIRINAGPGQSLNSAVFNQYLNDKSNAKSISSNFVTSILRLPNKQLWLGTESGGICKVLNSTATPTFKTFSEKDGLSNNVVKRILYDDNDNLWISTNNGLNRFDIKELAFTRYSKANGLPFQDFSFSASKLKNGKMFFSGVDGFCYFNPGDLPDSEPLPKIELGDLKVYNKTIQVGDTFNNRVLLDKRLSEMKDIRLKFDENMFSIEVTSLHFSTASNHAVKYQLLPLNKQWIDIPANQQYVYFNGLPPGNYTFRVKASNSLNQWTKPKVLLIKISPPFWKTIPAYILYVLLLAGIVYLVIHFVVRLKTLKHDIEIEEMEIKNVKEVNDAKLRVFGNISHEIKTPLTLISGPVDMLAESFKSNPLIIDKLQIVQRQTKKLAMLIDQVHDFQKADAQVLKISYSRFHFNKFMNDLASDFEFLAKNENKTIKVVGDETSIYVSADKDKLEKVFNNLLTNAFKFTRPGNTITIRYHHENSDLIVAVTDNGKGIEPDDLPHIFDRFYQSKKNKQDYFGGAGIGLAFSKQLVEMHYGIIKADSEVSKGTTMLVKLPIVIIQSGEDQQLFEEEILKAEEKAEQENISIQSANIANIKVEEGFKNSMVFIAEDNSDLRIFVAGLLGSFFKVKAFENGQECLDAMESEWPDIVVSDVLMPALNGLDLCRQIKSDIKTSHIPVILLTACTTVHQQIEGLEHGADAYIKKPFDIEHLIKTVEAILRGRKQLRERFKIDIPLTLENEKENKNDHAFLEKLYHLMAENLDNQELNLDDFAKDLYLNRTHFYQKVKALTNQTPFELLKLYRLKKAADLLLEGKQNVNEVYAMTGFKSRTHFSKLFKEKYEVTPGKYAEEAGKKYAAKEA